MRILLVGGGGREHALAWALSRSPEVGQLIAAPGNAGIAEFAECVPASAEDVKAIMDLADRGRPDLVVVGPEAPLVAGLVDELEARGIRAFGPGRAGARIEGSKVWAKALCREAGIPTAEAETFTDIAEAEGYLASLQPPYVVKAEGLAAGKGVTVATSPEQAAAALRASLVEGAFGEAGRRVLIEEHLSGPEVSALALTDGETVIPLAFAQDFKRVGDDDDGPNTGGMGAYSPVPVVEEETRKRIEEDVLHPTVAALRRRGIDYRGVLYAGLMLTSEGPKVLEFNARFGDPETQAILPRLDSDLAPLLLATAEGRLGERAVSWRDDACVTAILASGGYPGEYRTGIPIAGIEDASALDGVTVFHAGTALDGDGRVTTAGGRVLAVSALGKDLAAARERAYEAVSRIRFDGMHHRTDIAKEAAGG
ncbi:MAG: phosphoribosylamine--glycine ligase [Actinomycetota bacterium]|nr:phosphoribosylamine--glycine ligase [Actinomycetota bacterium]